MVFNIRPPILLECNGRNTFGLEIFLPSVIAAIYIGPDNFGGLVSCVVSCPYSYLNLGELICTAKYSGSFAGQEGRCPFSLHIPSEQSHPDILPYSFPRRLF